MKRQEPHKAITFRDIEVTKKYSGATIVSISLRILSLIWLVVGIIESVTLFSHTSDLWLSSADRIIFLLFMIVATLIVSTILFVYSYHVQILVDTEKHARRQLKLLWLQNKYCQDEYEEEEESW